MTSRGSPRPRLRSHAAPAYRSSQLRSPRVDHLETILYREAIISIRRRYSPGSVISFAQILRRRMMSSFNDTDPTYITPNLFAAQVIQYSVFTL